MFKSDHGFTLIEVTIALAVLAIGILAMFSLLTTGIRGNAAANRITNEIVHASDAIELVLSSDYSNANTSIDQDGDGAAGLTDAQCCQNGSNPSGTAVAGCTERADYCALSEDQRSFLYWNISANDPDANMKKVTITVRQVSGNSPDLVLSSIKTTI